MRPLFVLIALAVTDTRVTMTTPSTNTTASMVSGFCVLDGAGVATCTSTVPSGITHCVCTYASSLLAHVVSCGLSGTTMTALALTTLDAGTVNYICF